MKTFRLIGIALVAVLMCMTACSDGKDEPDTPTPKPDESAITIDTSIITNGVAFTTTGGEKTLSFSSNTNWTLSIAATTGGSTWCTASPTSGSKGEATVKFTTTENTDYDDRSVAVTIKAGTASKTFTITQKCKDAMLLTSDKFEVSQKGGSIDVEVKANIDYQMEISETAKSWITQANTRALTAHKHTFNIAANEEYDKREGEIYFINGNQKEIVKVYQTGGAVIMLTKNDYAVNDKGETVTVEIKSNFEYGIKMPDVDWISNVSARGASSHTLKYVVSPNETYDSRSAQIIYYDKSNTSVADTLTITQAQKNAIIISKKEYSADVNGETIEVELASNTEYSVSIANDAKDWISQVESKLTRALADSKLYFKIAANPSDKERTGTITISDGKGISETFTVTQEKPLLEITSDKTADVEAKGGTIEVKLNTNVDFDIEMPQADWISRVPDTRSLTEQTVKFTVSENTGVDSRSAEIVFTDKNKQIKETVTVTQQALIKTVTVKAAGTLGKLLGDQYLKIKALKVIGPLNGDDISIIRAMGGRYVDGSSSYGNLSYLDLSDASIVEGGGYYYYKNYYKNYYTSNDRIGMYMFLELSKLKTIILPNSVTAIEEYAFSGCTGLTSVTIPDSVITIGERAFYYCTELTSITIPNSVTTIEEWAFRDCTGLTSISIGNGVTSIGEMAFYKCTGLTSITIPNSVTTIGSYAFRDCTGLTSISIGNGVTSIGSFAFSGCSGLTSITIGSGVTSIEYQAFEGCTGLKEVHISDLKAWCNIKFRDNPLKNAHHLFLNGKEITKLVIPNSVTAIEEYAFSGCTGLTSVTIGNGVTTIEDYAFSGCTGLTSITIPNSVTTIGEMAFYKCTGLTSITIPNSVTTIGSYAFYGCKIKDCHIYATTPPKGGYAFDGGTIYAESTLYVPKGCAEAYKDWGTYFYNIVEME